MGCSARRRTRWTESQTAALLGALGSDASIASIAVRTGHSVQSVRAKLARLRMRARLGPQICAVWTSDSAVVLLDGIEPNEHGKGLAEARLRALHPLPEGKIRHSTDFEKRLRKIFEKQTGDREQPWLTLEFWQLEIDNVLVQGIFGRSGTKSGTVDRIHAVWPKLTVAWLGDRMEEVARASLPRWFQNEFWATEVDPILLVGVDRATRFQREAVDKVLRACPGLQIGAVWARLRVLRNRRNGEPEALSFADLGEPSCVAREGGSPAKEMSTSSGYSNDRRVWKSVDPVLLDGIRQANRCERQAVDKALGAFPELRIAAIWARLRRLRNNQETGGPLPWTDELDERLVRVYREAGLSASVSDIQNLTGWPRRAVLRRAHKLGLPSEPAGNRRRWTMSELRFAIESVNHLSVREIADELERSEKAVWDMVGHRGIPAKFQDGYSVRELSAKLHVRRPSIRTWIKAGLLHKKRNGRIAEDSLQSFLHNHPERINWPLLDEDTTFWVSELLEAERIRVNGSGVRTRASSRSSEVQQAAGASMPAGTASSAPEADPSEDRASHNNRARAASPQQ